MRNAIIIGALTLTLSACAQQNKANECFVTTVKEATQGNFSHWVLPDFVGGKHMRAGQYMNANCEVVN